MISCLLIQVSRNAHGLPVRKESVVSGETIQIGRGAACRIHLLDHRVGLLHATIRRSEKGSLYIEGEKDSSINVNSFIEQNAELTPGTHIGIGPYEIAVEPVVNGHDITLSVEMTLPLSGSSAVETRLATPVTLATLGLSKRKIGFSLAFFILFIFLLLPLLPSTSLEIDKWQSTLPVALTEPWSPGALSGGHVLFGAQCSTCHKQAFQKVADEVCLGCHTQIPKHLTDEVVQADSFKNVRCTDCHTDHKGNAALIQHDSTRCVNCHADLKSKTANPKIADIRNFESDHPSFQINLQSTVFAHSKHSAVSCTNCHDVTNPKTTPPVAMPSIDKCRECHAGDHPAKGKIRSTCDSCHRFHKAVKDVNH